MLDSASCYTIRVISPLAIHQNVFFPFSPWSSEVLITGDYNLSVVHDTDEEDELDLYNSKKR